MPRQELSCQRLAAPACETQPFDVCLEPNRLRSGSPKTWRRALMLRGGGIGHETHCLQAISILFEGPRRKDVQIVVQPLVRSWVIDRLGLICCIRPLNAKQRRRLTPLPPKLRTSASVVELHRSATRQGHSGLAHT